MKKRYKGILFILISLFLLSLPIGVMATTVIPELEENKGDTTLEVEKEIIQVEFKEIESVVGLYQGDTLIMQQDSEALNNLESYIVQSIREEFKQGLTTLRNKGTTRDHIEMKLWGGFLYKYLGKTAIDMPSDNIKIETETIKYEIKGNKAAKEWLEKEIIPLVIKNMQEDGKIHPAEKYRIALDINKRWKEVGELDLTNKNNLEKISTEYPMSEDTSTYLVYNTGTIYGVMLNPKYVEILKGYNEELGYTLTVQSENPAIVSTLVPIVYLKNLENSTLEGKSFYDMAIYNDLAVDLETKTLIDTKELKEEKTALEYKDYNLKEEDLIMVNLADSTVLVQSKYLECFKWGNREYNTGTWVDFSELLLGNSNTATFSNGTIDVKTYQDNGDIVNTQLGKRNPFLIFASANNLPFDRLLMWIHSDTSVGEMPEEQKKEMQKTIKNIMYEQGKKAEYKEYLKAAGGSTTPYIIIGGVIILLIAGAVGVIVIKKKKNKTPDKEIDMSDLLFDTKPTKEDNNVEDDDNLFK